MDRNIHELFLQLIRLGIGHTDTTDIAGEVDWLALKALADTQGLSAIALDGLDKLNTNRPNFTNISQTLRLEWIGEVLQGEQTYKLHQEVAEDMAGLFHRKGIRTYVLKGRVISECYPKPEHRVSSDMDCFLVSANSNPNDDNWSSHEEAWKRGNELIKAKGFEVGDGFYKNSSFCLPGLMVENHLFMTPFRGNDVLMSLEKVLQSLLSRDDGNNLIEGTWLYRPPVMASALFMIEHAYSHFLHEGLTWRMVLDWMLFSEKHKEAMDWHSLNNYIDQFGFRKFYDSYHHLGQYLIGEIQDSGLSSQDRRMLEDILAPLDLHESLHGVKAKFQLAGNYWRARWKYRYFTDTTWIRALLEWVLGATFHRHPKLD